ncbi:ATP-binding cassette domain-containing protein [Candidatus Fermentibacteria bacterium]|nr:ATP-binding cassette domain-containing protein [Candidatus Fermentibacteria bacterium]
MDVELVVQDLEKRFGGVRAVDDLSFAVRGNELVGLIGPNGSGKTTTIDTICGLLRPSGGRISFQGRRVDHLPPYRRAEMGLGRTFQVTRVFRRMSVLQNLMVPAMATGETDRSRTETRAEEILEMLTLDHLGSENADSLSGGQRKLLELGRVLMLDPDLIFLDEPFAGVHPRLRGQIHSYIRRVHANGKAFVIVSHDMDSIFELCQRVIVMNEGRKIADGDPEAVRSEKAVIDAYLGEASEREQLEHVGSGEGPDA